MSYIGQVANAAGWFSIYDLDYRTVSLATAAGDGTLAAGAYNYNVANFANATTISVGSTTGVRLKCNTTNSSNTPTNRTGPCISLPALSSLSAWTTSNRFGLRVSMYVGAYTQSTNGDSFSMYVDTGNNNQRYELSQYKKAVTGIIHFGRLVLGNSVKSTVDINDPYCPASSGNADCFQMEIPFFGSDLTIYRVGNYSSGWPTSWNNIGDNTAASGAWLPAQMATAAQGFVTFAAETGNTSGTSEVNIYRAMVEVRPL